MTSNGMMIAGETYLDRETALKLKRIQTGPLDQGIHPGAARRCRQKSRCMVDPALRGAATAAGPNARPFEPVHSTWD
jgi:hypothetical protein